MAQLHTGHSLLLGAYLSHLYTLQQRRQNHLVFCCPAHNQARRTLGREATSRWIHNASRALWSRLGHPLPPRPGIWERGREREREREVTMAKPPVITIAMRVTTSNIMTRQLPL